MTRLRIILLVCLACFTASAQGTQYPSALDTNASLFIVADNVQTTLNLAMLSSDATMTVVSATGFVPNMIATICDTANSFGRCTAFEHMLVTNVSGSVLSVTRGYAGTTARSHARGAAVSVLIDAAHQQSLKAAIIAIETALGPNLSNITGSTAQAAGPSTSVQSNLNGSFTGSGNFTWDNSSQFLTINGSGSGFAGIVVSNGYIQSAGGFQTPGTGYNAVWASIGGIAGRSLTASTYIQTGNSFGTPSATSGDTINPGAMYWDSNSHCEQVFSDSSTWGCLSTNPGGSVGQVQFFGSGGQFAGSANFSWSNGSQALTITGIANAASLTIVNGFIQSDAGFVVTSSAAYNAIQAGSGGIATRSITASAYTQIGHSAGDPTLTAGDSFHNGTIYYNDTNGCLKVYASGSFGCISGGGGGAAAGNDTQLQFNNGGAFGASSQLTWSSVPQVLTVTGLTSSPGITVLNGYVGSDGGFAVTSSGAFNSVQSAKSGGNYTGGMAARSFTAQVYIQSGNANAAPTVTTSDVLNAGALYWDNTAHCEKVYTDGAAWSCLTAGSTLPGGSPTNVQFNNSGAFGGSANFAWDNTAQTLTITGIASTPALAVLTGFVTSDGGFAVTSSTAFDSVHATKSGSNYTGGMAARSFTAQVYIETGNSTGAPTLTTGDALHAGAMYWDNTAHCEQVYTDGASWTCLGGGGGTPAGANTQIQFNNSGVMGATSELTYATSSHQLSVGMGSAGGYVYIDRSAENNGAWIDFSVAGTTAAAGGWQLGVNPDFRLYYGASALNYLDIKESGEFYIPYNSSASRAYFGSQNHQLSFASGQVPVITNGPFVSTSGDTDASILDFSLVPGQFAAFASGSTGSGVPLPMVFYVGVNRMMTFDTTNHTLFGFNSNTYSTAVQVNGVVAAAGGFAVGSSNSFDSVHAAVSGPNYLGGMAARSFTAQAYVQTGNSGSDPSITTSDTFHAGAMYWNSTDVCEKAYDGSAFVCVGNLVNQVDASFSRSLGTTYQNTTHKTMYVDVTLNVATSDTVIAKTENVSPPGAAYGSVTNAGTSGTALLQLHIVVKPGNYYRLDSVFGSSSLSKWWENY